MATAASLPLDGEEDDADEQPAAQQSVLIINFGEAEGGTIRITSPAFKQTGSVLDASSNAGPDGTVTINGVVQP